MPQIGRRRQRAQVLTTAPGRSGATMSTASTASAAGRWHPIARQLRALGLLGAPGARETNRPVATARALAAAVRAPRLPPVVLRAERRELDASRAAPAVWPRAAGRVRSARGVVRNARDRVAGPRAAFWERSFVDKHGLVTQVVAGAIVPHEGRLRAVELQRGLLKALLGQLLVGLAQAVRVALALQSGTRRWVKHGPHRLSCPRRSRRTCGNLMHSRAHRHGHGHTGTRVHSRACVVTQKRQPLARALRAGPEGDAQPSLSKRHVPRHGCSGYPRTRAPSFQSSKSRPRALA